MKSACEFSKMTNRLASLEESEMRHGDWYWHVPVHGRMKTVRDVFSCVFEYSIHNCERVGCVSLLWATNYTS